MFDNLDEEFSDHVYRNNVSGVIKCIKNGVDVNIPRTINTFCTEKFYPLHWCAFTKQIKMCQTLLDANADVTLRRSNGWTAFDDACNGKNSAIAKLLAYAGSDVTRSWLLQKCNNIAYGLYINMKCCVSALIVFYGIVRKRQKRSKDTTQCIMRMVYEKRFDFIKIK